MRLVKAFLKKKTDDGLVEMKDKVPIGKEYEIDIDTIQEAGGLNIELMQEWRRLIVFNEYGRWFPLELLDIPFFNQ